MKMIIDKEELDKESIVNKFNVWSFLDTKILKISEDIDRLAWSEIRLKVEEVYTFTFIIRNWIKDLQRK